MRPRVVPLLALALLVAAARGVEFYGEADVGSGVVGPRSVFVADLNADLHLDVLVAATGDVSWFPSDGLGGFLERRVVTSSVVSATSVIAFDVDEDGSLDVVASSYFNSKVYWYRNNGTGGFGGQRVVSETPGNPLSLFGADVDGDGHGDVVVANDLGRSVAWYRNNGTGGFSEGGVVTDALPAAARSVFVADLAGNGFADVLVPTSGGLTWFENDGAGGGWAERVLVDGAIGTADAAAGDLDGDGDLDVVLVSSGGDGVVWFENVGGSTFGQPTLVAAVSSTSVFLADVDADGDLDVFAAPDAGAVTLHVNNGAGNFPGPGLVFDSAAATTGVFSVFVADLDGDNEADLATALFFEDQVALHKQRPRRQAVSDAGGRVPSVVLADVNLDGNVDIVTGSDTTTKAAYYLNDGGGSFGFAQKIPGSEKQPGVLATADFNGDGYPDLVETVFVRDRVSWFAGGEGGFGERRDIDVALNGVRGVAAGFLDSDGALDVVVAAQRNGSINWYRNNGTGGFSERLVIDDDADGARSVAVGDINRDGRGDVVASMHVSSGSDGLVVWYANNGSGFERRVVDEVAGVGIVMVADLSGDGFPDILAASFNNDTVTWYPNNNGTGFGARRVVAEMDGPFSLDAADVDSDGDFDVLATFLRSGSGRVVWFENTDGVGGSWTEHVLSDGALTNLQVVLAADLTGRGAPLDVVFADAVDGLGWFTLKADSERLASSAVVGVTSEGGNDMTCAAGYRPDRPCATLGAAAEIARSASATLPRDIQVTVIALSAGRISAGESAVALDSPPGGLLLSVQVAAEGAELVCPSTVLGASCVTIGTGVALFGGPLTVTGGRSYADGGCVTVAAGPAAAGAADEAATAEWPFRVPLFDSVLSRPLQSFVWRDDAFRLVLGTAPGGVQPARPPAAVPPARPAEASLTLRGCRSARRGGGLAIAAAAGAAATGGAAAEVGSVTVEDCRADADGGGVAALWSLGSTLLSRALTVRNCTAGLSGGGLYVESLQLFGVLAGAGAALTLEANAAPLCGGDLAVQGSQLGAGTDLTDLRLLLSPGAPPVCVSLGARAVLPECGAAAGADVLAAESRRGALVSVPLSCAPAPPVTCAGGEAAYTNGTAICSACARGEAPGGGGGGECTPCEAGRFAGSEGQNECEPCAEGRSTQGQSGAVSCAACPRGEYASGTGAPACERCAAGRFQNGTEREGCERCPPGRSSDAPGAVECTTCGAGRFTPNETDDDGASQTCQPCGEGRFSAAAEASSCEPCAAGSASGAEGAVGCVLCPRGEYASTTGLTRCEACPEGRFQPDANATACLECGAGSFSDSPGSVRCVPCSPGRASAANGSTACDQCAPHTFAGAEGLSACVPCNASEFRFADREGAQFCDRCDPDEYLSYPDRSDTATFRGCLPCPEGASCASGRPLALSAQWFSPLDAETGEYRALDCLPGRCLPARECAGAAAADGDDSTSCCAAGRRLPAAENPMCGACEAGTEEWGGECVPCARTDTGLVLAYLALGVALLLVLQHVTANSSGAALSKVVVGFAQVAFAFFADDGDDSPVRGGAALSFNPLGLESKCVAPMSDLTRAVLPLVQLLLVCVLFVAIGALNAAWWLACGRRRRFRTSPFTRVLVALAVFGYVPVFRVAVNLLRCEDLPGGARVLRQFPTVSCSSGGYLAWVAVSWTLACALLVGLSSLILAYGRPRYLAYWPDGAGADKQVRKAMEKRIGFLHLSYRGDSALSASWEVAILARSSVYVAAAALGGSGDSRFALLTLVSVGALVAHLYVQPFRHAADNRLETVALTALLVIGSLNNSGWRGSSAARAATSLLYYGLIAAAVVVGVYLKQERLRAAARAARGHLKSFGSSSSAGSLADAGGGGRGGGSCAGVAAWVSGVLCWHLPRPESRSAGAAHAPAAEAGGVEMDAGVSRDETVLGSDGRQWNAWKDDNGVPYYSCVETGETSWERPG